MFELELKLKLLLEISEGGESKQQASQRQCAANTHTCNALGPAPIAGYQPHTEAASQVEGMLEMEELSQDELKDLL